MGEGESAMTERDFHIMNAVERTSAKLSTCWRVWRGEERMDWRSESMVAVVLGVVRVCEGEGDEVGERRQVL